MALRLRRRSAALGLTFLTALATTGCNSPDPDNALEKVASWAATAHLTADARLTDAITGRYATQTLRAAVGQLDEQWMTLRSAELEPLLHDEVLKTTSELRRTISAMAIAAKSDRLALARELAHLEPLEREVKALHRTVARQ